MLKKLCITNLQEKILDTFSTTLDENRNAIISFLKNTLGPVSITALHQDEVIQTIATHIYRAAPLPARLAIKEESFISFLMNNKDRVIVKLEPLVASTKIAEKETLLENEHSLLNHERDEQANNQLEDYISMKTLDI